MARKPRKPKHRQQLYAAHLVAAGLCRICAAPLNRWKTLCDAHQARESARVAEYRATLRSPRNPQESAV